MYCRGFYEPSNAVVGRTFRSRLQIYKHCKFLAFRQNRRNKSSVLNRSWICFSPLSNVSWRFSSHFFYVQMRLSRLLDPISLQLVPILCALVCEANTVPRRCNAILTARAAQFTGDDARIRKHVSDQLPVNTSGYPEVPTSLVCLA